MAGFLSRFDTSIREQLPTNKFADTDSDWGLAKAIVDPLGLPVQQVLSGERGLAGTPTQEGVDSRFGTGLDKFGNQYGGESAALVAALLYGANSGALGYFGEGGGGGEGAAAGGGEYAAGAPYGGGEEYGVMGAGGGGGGGGEVGFDPGAEGMYAGDATGTQGSDPILLADSGTTQTDVSPGLFQDNASPGATEISSPSATDQELDAAIRSSQSQPTTTGSGSSFMDQAKKYSVPLGLLGLSTALSSKKSEMPNKAQYQELSAEAQALAKTLIEQYKSGTLSPAQQAQLDQLTKGQKNQINNYYASIRQAGSTSHQQAIAKADMDGLAIKANMLQSSLQQGLQAIGVAQGPLNAMASYQMQNDKRLQDSYANFARSAAYLYGANSGPSKSA